MRLPIRVTYIDPDTGDEGDSETVIAFAPDFVKWEAEFNAKVADFAEGRIAYTDLCYIAYSALHRRNGKEMKPFSFWIQGVAEVTDDFEDGEATTENPT